MKRLDKRQKEKSLAHSSRMGQMRGQINLSFGMLFSIILIIVFIVFAFYAIGKFLDIQKSVKVGQFSESLKADVDRMWKSSSGSQAVEYSLPSSVESVCFTDFGESASSGKEKTYDSLRMVHFNEENTFFYPVGSAGGVDSVKINNIDLTEITKKENPYCIESVNEKIKLTIKKDIGSALVVVTR